MSLPKPFAEGISIARSSSLDIKLTYNANKPGHSVHSAKSSSKTIYFGYGSNLWLDQMRRRCPTSKYLGIARLKGYKWIIFSKGAANIVELKQDSQARDKHDYSREVWGLVYSLEPDDEESLDGFESVPTLYGKEWIECEFWAVGDDADEQGHVGATKPDTSKDPESIDMLVYINRELVEGSEPREEYIHRMNHAIHDGLQEGVPSEYVKQVMREYIPEEEEGERV